LIDFESVILVLQKFQYLATSEDRNELRVWLFNRNMFVQPPKYYDPNLIFVDLDLFLSSFKLNDNNESIDTVDNVKIKIRENLVKRNVEKAVEAVTLHGERIGERELRKIVNQTMHGVSLTLQNVFIDQIRNYEKPDDKNLFRMFNTAEVVQALRGLMKQETVEVPKIDMDQYLLSDPKNITSQ
jgi:hypothetical protein